MKRVEKIIPTVSILFQKIASETVDALNKLRFAKESKAKENVKRLKS